MKIAIHIYNGEILGAVAKGAPADLEIVSFEYSNTETPGALPKEVVGRPDLEGWYTAKRVGVQDAASVSLEINKLFS